jgi:hypothetical protein
MNQVDFNKIVKARIREIESMLVTKGREYSNSDRLSNFKDGAALRKQQPETVLWGYVTKHIVSLNEFMIRIEAGHTVTPEQWIEKLQDTAVYMLLLETILTETGRLKP